jgi:hypothetical protein
MGLGENWTLNISVFTIRVKWLPKPDPVKRRRRPLAAFISRSLPCLLVIYSSHPTPSPTLLALPGAGHRRYPPRRFVSSPSAAPTAPLGSAFLASPGCHQFYLDFDQPHRLAHMLLSNRSGADDDADDDVQYRPRPSGLGSPCAVHARMPRTTSLPSSRLLHLSARAVEPLSA